MASRIAVMSEGRFLQVGTPGEVYETPASRFVADFIGNVNLMDGTLVEDEAGHCVVRCADCEHWIGHGITGTLNMPVTVALRPEKIVLRRERPAEARNCVGGKIEEMSYFGATTVYRVRLASDGQTFTCWVDDDGCVYLALAHHQRAIAMRRHARDQVVNTYRKPRRAAFPCTASDITDDLHQARATFALRTVHQATEAAA